MSAVMQPRVSNLALLGISQFALLFTSKILYEIITYSLSGLVVLKVRLPKMHVLGTSKNVLYCIKIHIISLLIFLQYCAPIRFNSTQILRTHDREQIEMVCKCWEKTNKSIGKSARKE